MQKEVFNSLILQGNCRAKTLIICNLKALNVYLPRDVTRTKQL